MKISRRVRTTIKIKITNTKRSSVELLYKLYVCTSCTLLLQTWGVGESQWFNLFLVHRTVVVTYGMRQVRDKTDNPPDITWLYVLFGNYQRIDKFFSVYSLQAWCTPGAPKSAHQLINCLKIILCYRKLILSLLKLNNFSGNLLNKFSNDTFS